MKPFDPTDKSRPPRKSGARERDFDELLETAEVKDFFFRAEREMFPKLQQSAISLSIFTGHVDAKLAMEFGAAILLDKPILFVALNGVKIPEKLRKCADVIVEVSGLQTPEDQRKVQEALIAMGIGKEDQS